MQLPEERFDAVVIGGGVYGILLALEGAARGQHVLLLERDDFGCGASFNHLRTIHGGLRYLQFLDVRRAVASNRQRLWWLRNFPDLVHPIDCLMPLYGQGLKRAEAFRGAFLMARALAMHKDGQGRSGRMEVVPRPEAERLLPACRRDGLDCGAIWQDAFMPWPHRLIAELVHWAEHAGAMAWNRIEFCSARRREDGVWLARIEDRRSGESAEVGARWLINATAAAADEVAARMTGSRGKGVLVPTLGWGLLLDHPPLSECSVAVAPPGKGRRTYFLHPYHGRVLAGTGHAGVLAEPGRPVRMDEEMALGTLAELDEALPGTRLTPDMVRHVFWGVLPGVTAGSEALLMHPAIVDHGRRDNAPGAWTVLGVKFTEAPFVARRLWDRILGTRAAVLPRRPKAVDVPSIAEVRQMTDAQLREAMRVLSALEWQADAEDLVWRRTDLWMDSAQASRVARLMAA